MRSGEELRRYLKPKSVNAHSETEKEGCKDQTARLYREYIQPWRNSFGSGPAHVRTSIARGYSCLAKYFASNAGDGSPSSRCNVYASLPSKYHCTGPSRGQVDVDDGLRSAAQAARLPVRRVLGRFAVPDSDHDIGLRTAVYRTDIGPSKSERRPERNIRRRRDGCANVSSSLQSRSPRAIHALQRQSAAK